MADQEKPTDSIDVIRVPLKALREPRFSHADTLFVTGLTSDQLLTWHKRGLLANIAETAAGGQGRGVRRKYCLLDLWYLSLMREMTEISVPVGWAAGIAVSLLSIFKHLTEYGPGLRQASHTPVMVLAIFREGEEIRSDILDAKLGADVLGWMRERLLRRACFIDLVALHSHMSQKLLELK